MAKTDHHDHDHASHGTPHTDHGPTHLKAKKQSERKDSKPGVVETIEHDHASHGTPHGPKHSKAEIAKGTKKTNRLKDKAE